MKSSTVPSPQISRSTTGFTVLSTYADLVGILAGRDETPGNPSEHARRIEPDVARATSSTEGQSSADLLPWEIPLPEEDFFEVLFMCSEHSKFGTLPAVRVEYDHINVFGYLPRAFLRSVTNRPNIRGRFLHELHPNEQIAVLSTTYWWRIIKPPVRAAFISLVRERKLLAIKEIVNTCDGILSSLFLSVPQYKWDYEFTDQIMVSVLSNVLLDKTFLPRWKEYKKIFRKNLLSGLKAPPPDQSWSWFTHLLPYFETETRLGATCLMNFCQTRNTGLGLSPEGEALSLKKFVNTTTKPSAGPLLGDKPSEYLRVAIRENITERAIERARSNMHCSISTTACFEAGRKHRDPSGKERDYGKGGLAADLLTIIKEWKSVDLETGEYIDDPIPENQFGEKLFHLSLSRYKESYSHLYDANISVIREPGPKWRTITASSFYHSQILQPWSHATLEILRCIPEASSGISKSRHGWELAEALSPEDPALDWLFEEGCKAFGLSTDLEEATDHFDWEVVKDIVECLNDELGFPKWYGKVVLELLTTTRNIFYKGKLLCKTQRAALMGDPGTKTVLTSLGIAVIYAGKQRNRYVIARVIGDDFAAVSREKALLEFFLEKYREWRTKVSDSDTYISDRYVYFTEELVVIPRSVHDTIDRIKKSRCWGRSPYIDCVKGRLLIDVKKNRDDYSFTPVGRLTQLGKDISYLKERSDPTALFHLASVLQDVYIDLPHRYDGHIYFPVYVTGEGKPPAFNVPMNAINVWYNQMKGKFIRNIATIVQETVAYIHSHGMNVERSDLIRYATLGPFRHSDKEPWLFTPKPVDDPLITEHLIHSVPRYEKFSSTILGRLTRFIISETEVAGALAKEEHLRFLLTGEEPDKLEKRLIDIDPNDIPVTEEELKTFFHHWLSDPNGLRPIRLERYFDRDPVERIIGEKHPLKVWMGFHPLATYVKYEGRFLSRENRDKMEDHDQVALYEWLKQALADPTSVPDIPRRNIADDEILIDQIGIHDNRQHLFIVTDDIKLVRKLAMKRHLKNPRLRTYRLPVILWLSAKCSYRVFENPVIDWNNVEIDLGSYEAKMAQLNIHGVSNFSSYDPDENKVKNILPFEKYRPVKVYKGEFGKEPIKFPIRNFPERYLVVPRL